MPKGPLKKLKEAHTSVTRKKKKKPLWLISFRNLLAYH